MLFSLPACLVRVTYPLTQLLQNGTRDRSDRLKTKQNVHTASVAGLAFCNCVEATLVSLVHVLLSIAMRLAQIQACTHTNMIQQGKTGAG